MPRSVDRIFGILTAILDTCVKKFVSILARGLCQVASYDFKPVEAAPTFHNIKPLLQESLVLHRWTQRPED